MIWFYINNSIDFFLTLLIGLYEKIFLYQCIENLYLEAIILVLIITNAICKEIVVSSLIDKSIFIKPKAEDLIVGNEITNVISRKRIPEKVKWTNAITSYWESTIATMERKNNTTEIITFIRTSGEKLKYIIKSITIKSIPFTETYIFVQANQNPKLALSYTIFLTN